jgi:polyhydroxyalkanoate synthesis regulator phasin
MEPDARAVEMDASRKMNAIADGASAALVAIQPGPGLPAGASAAIARKIVYDAQVDLIVESVDPVAKKVGSLVQEARGYIAEQSVAGSPGSQRSMRWRVRIPVEQFDSFVDSIVALGELERNNRTSQDVTEQYYDIEARIKNKKVEEQTLNKILQERSGKLEDILKIEIELSRVRGEIEQLEGKIRVLENLSSLATLTLNIRERDKYAPPAPVVADFATQVARTWNGSLLDLVNMGKSFALWTVSWAIWIPFFMMAALLGLIMLRWLLRVFLRNLPRLVVLARTPITSPRAPTASE